MCVIIDGDDGKFEVYNDDGECARADFFFHRGATHQIAKKQKPSFSSCQTNIHTYYSLLATQDARSLCVFSKSIFQEGFQDRPTGVKTAISPATPKILLYLKTSFN